MCTLLFLTLLVSLLLSSPPPSPPLLPSPPLPYSITSSSTFDTFSFETLVSSHHAPPTYRRKRGKKKGALPIAITVREETDNDGGRLHARERQGGSGEKEGGRGRETDARRPEREEGTLDGKSEREVREDGVRMVCQDIAERRSRQQGRNGSVRY